MLSLTYTSTPSFTSLPVFSKSKMSCTIPANQPIYQALIDKAASYPADKIYQAKAYKKAAESVLNYNKSFYNSIIETIPGIGQNIEEFIDDFVASNPLKAPEPVLTGAAKAMDDARKAAAAAAPKDVTAWPNDDAARAAFQAKLAASKVIESAPVQEAFNQLRTAIGLLAKPLEKPKTALDFYYESQKPVVYTAENPRRSKRVASKPKVDYFTKEDESDDDVEDDSDEEYIDVDEDVAEAIETICVKKGWTYSDALVTDFETWLPTADKYSTQKYDWRTGKDIPRAKPDVAKYWAQYYSKNIQEQKKQMALSKSLIKYCQKNNIEYKDVMGKKFAEWKADPTNKKLITYTYTSAKYGWCRCASCDPTGEKKKATETIVTEEYSYERSPAYCINKWFSTLKKTIVW